MIRRTHPCMASEGTAWPNSGYLGAFPLIAASGAAERRDVSGPPVLRFGSLAAMPTRRDFIRGAVLGAAALAVGGCSENAEADPPIQGLQPIRYGDSRSQAAELLLPDKFGPFPVVVIIHGGWWSTGWDRRFMRDLAEDLVRRGYATWNLEYRLLGDPDEEGGGWPGTFEDVANGIDALADKAPDFNLDLSRVVFLGHSAGGHLALWAASRSTFEAGFVGANPKVEPTSVVALAPVCDLVAAANQNLGNGAVQKLLGGSPTEVPLTYATASPTLLRPGPARHILIHSTMDETVPVEQSRTYAQVARERGADVELIEVPAGDHFAVIDIKGETWIALRDRMGELLEPPPVATTTTTA
jgi:acetyl esterase/lipase